MPSFLITLVSATSRKSGLGILDTNLGFHYLQIDPQDLQQFPFSMYRGVTFFEQQVYLTTPQSIRVYGYGKNPKSPVLSLKQEISYYDWPLTSAKPPYVGLVPILLSKKRNRILVGNNSQCAVDELSFSGKFIRRSSLWSIAPDVFKAPKVCKLGFTYGQTRQLCEADNGSIYMTVANCYGLGRGKIIDFDTGKVLLDGLHDPHGGIIANELYVLQDTLKGPYGRAIENGKLTAYALPAGKTRSLNRISWRRILKNDTHKRHRVPQQLRGIAVADNKIYCGASFFGGTNLQMRPNRIISFDATNGRQAESFDLPDLVDFRNPQIFGMTLLPDNWNCTRPGQELTYFSGEKQVEPKLYVQPVKKTPPKKKKIVEQTALPPQTVQKKKVKTVKKVVLGSQSVSIDHVSLCYRRTGHFLFSLSKKERTSKKYWALRNVSTTFYEGETIGLIGRNGSGKSTLSMMISGALTPDKGKVITHGRVQLLALGIGFRPLLTGRENVMISGAILGMARKNIKAQMEEIEDFAELGDFFDEPIRTYSAGMKSRLGFAVSTAVEPDILILDEVMSTGDAAFRNKANKRMEKMRAKTKTVIIVSHSPGQVKELCSRVIWLEQGRLVMDGSTTNILPIYEEFCQNPDQWLCDHQKIANLLSDL